MSKDVYKVKRILDLESEARISILALSHSDKTWSLLSTSIFSGRYCAKPSHLLLLLKIFDGFIEILLTYKLYIFNVYNFMF